ncbi:LysR family transcriptional regulator [Salinibius halmophilus]|uniref:LysR family transcriptional regulator n=1 Tax=Salinibius halmophilus TaxID=1853216 RepID=UPI000E667FBF|nr:LysR family transcriptional regulator [Salinibius halmophilus]
MQTLAHKKFERYYLFSAVAEQLSFRLAAEQLGISTSYLSQQVRQLEKQLGETLLIRTTRSVRLTAEGQALLAGMQQIKQQVTELERSLVKHHSEVSGTLKITSAAIFAQRYLLPACQAFRQQFPDVVFAIDAGYQNHDLTRMPFDLAIRATNAPPENMVAKKLMHYRHAVVAAPSYWARFGKPSSPSELSQHNCLSDPNLQAWLFEQGDQHIAVQTSGSMVINDNFMLLNAAIAGEGVIKLPDYLSQPAVQAGQLQAVLTDYKSGQRDIYALYPQKLSQSELLSHFLQFLQDFVAQS